MIVFDLLDRLYDQEVHSQDEHKKTQPTADEIDAAVVDVAPSSWVRYLLKPAS